MPHHTHAEEDGEAWNELRCELWLAFPYTDLWGPHLTMSSAEWRINKGKQKTHTHTHTHTYHLYTCQAKHHQGSSRNSHECQQYNHRLGWQLTHWPADRHWCQGRKSQNVAELSKEFTVVQVCKMVSSHGGSKSSSHVLHTVINHFWRGLLAFQLFVIASQRLLYMREVHFHFSEIKK